MSTELFTADPGPAVESQVAGDMARRMLPVFPVLVLVAGLIWGVDGAISGALAVVLVLANLALSAALLGWAARISLALLMAAALGGFILRLVLLTAVVYAVKDQGWVDIVALGITLAVTHVGLLIWETRHVSASLAYPGLKPTPSKLIGGHS
ncbi:MAG TPA: ATP synthase subunit I [Acidimicrobiales bacterium]|nr:ATP synthase subunit I [Acidimicrobiales bacterium]